MWLCYWLKLYLIIVICNFWVNILVGHSHYPVPEHVKIRFVKSLTDPVHYSCNTFSDCILTIVVLSKILSFLLFRFLSKRVFLSLFLWGTHVIRVFVFIFTCFLCSKKSKIFIIRNLIKWRKLPIINYVNSFLSMNVVMMDRSVRVENVHIYLFFNKPILSPVNKSTAI